MTATQDYRSKTTGGKVRLSVLEKEAGGTMTHLLTINAGKFKTVAQLTATLADIFRKDLDVPAANQEIGKIGDLGHGGEIRFVAESNDTLRYDWAAPGEPVHSTRWHQANRHPGFPRHPHTPHRRAPDCETPAVGDAVSPAATCRAAQKNSGMIRIATMLTTLIIGLIAGPAVSL